MAERPEGIPAEQVRKMRAQGFDDQKIVETLQRDGYRSSHIFDAMTKADMKPATEVKEVTEDFPDIMGSVGSSNEPRAPRAPPRTVHSPFVGDDVEELVESIIEEKWEEIIQNIRKVLEWKNDTEKRIDDVEQGMQELKGEFDKLHQAVIGKIGEYDKNIMNVGAEIKAMEKAFSKIIPEFADSVTELTELVDDLKKDKKDSKPKED